MYVCEHVHVCVSYLQLHLGRGGQKIRELEEKSGAKIKVTIYIILPIMYHLANWSITSVAGIPSCNCIFTCITYVCPLLDGLAGVLGLLNTA